MSHSEEELVDRAKRGQRDALVELLSLSGPVARRVVENMISPAVQSMLTADDVMQQAYTDAYLHIQQFKYVGPNSFDKWLTTLAKRNCVDGVRALQAAKRGGAFDRVTKQNDSIATIMDIVKGTSATPSRAVAGAEAKTALTRAIEQLPPLYQQVVQKLDLQSIPVAQVAEELNRSPGAVYMLRARAHDQLLEIMGSASRYLSDGA